MVDRLPLDAQTVYAELVALLSAIEAERGWSNLAGSFSEKRIRGGDYVYFQYSDPGGKRRQISIGRANPAIRAIVERHGAGRNQLEEAESSLQRLGKLLAAAGATVLPHGPARVLHALADAGMFRLGAVLIGSHAFSMLGNALGVRWTEAAWRTQDVDIAAHVQIGTPPIDVDVPATLDSLSKGFLPVPQLDPREPSTTFMVRGKELRVDLLTPGREGQESPVPIRRFRAAAAPVKHLSLLIDDAWPAPAVHSRGAMLVLLPTPARMALHKLFVSQTRSLAQQTKSAKDLLQAALLLEVLHEDRIDDLVSTSEVFVRSGAVVTAKLRRALQTVERRYPSARGGVEVVRAHLA